MTINGILQIIRQWKSEFANPNSCLIWYFQMKQDTNTEFWTQIGVVSWGGNCGGRHPGFYTSVASIMGLIWQTLEKSRIGKCTNIYPRYTGYDVV